MRSWRMVLQVALWEFRRFYKLRDQLLSLALAVLGGAFGFGVQYLVWPLPFLLFALPRKVAYTLNVTLSLFLFATYTIWAREFPWWFADAAAPNPLRPLIAVVAASSSAARDTTVALNQDGRVKEFLVSVFPVRDAARVMGTVVLLKDLESFKTVQSLISYSAKLAALGRLTSGVAHEVRNPLNAMMIHVELLRDRLASTPPDVQQSLDIIGSEVQRLDRVVQGFLRFMRPQELSLKALDLNALLGSVAALLEAEWQARGVHFQWDVDSALPPIRADEELLRQAFLNILQNACQAMPVGGTVTISTAREGRELIRVSIADEGMGIPAENLEKIFKLYFTTKPDGSGIGLSIVYRIIQMHDGTIEARSENRQGTTMVVRLLVRQGA